MLRDLLANVTSIGGRREQHVQSADLPQAPGAGDAADSSRRTLIRRGLALVAGAVSVSVAGSALANASTNSGAAPAAALPTTAARPTELSLFVRDVRFSSPGLKPGELPTGKPALAPHGALRDGSGSILGSFSGGVLPGSGGRIGFQRFVFAGGTLIGMGSGSLENEEYAVVGGTGQYAGATGTYSTKLQCGDHGRDAEFRFNVTGSGG